MRILAVALIMFTVAGAAEAAPRTAPDPGAWGADGPVFELAAHGDRVFAAGDFSSCDRAARQGPVPYGRRRAARTPETGTVNRAVSDGAGGFFVDGYGCYGRLWHIDADGRRCPASPSRRSATSTSSCCTTSRSRRMAGCCTRRQRTRRRRPRRGHRRRARRADRRADVVAPAGRCRTSRGRWSCRATADAVRRRRRALDGRQHPRGCRRHRDRCGTAVGSRARRACT